MTALFGVISLWIQAVANSVISEMGESEGAEKERNEDDQVLRSRISSLATFTVCVLLSVSAWKLVLLNRFFR